MSALRKTFSHPHPLGWATLESAQQVRPPWPPLLLSVALWLHFGWRSVYSVPGQTQLRKATRSQPQLLGERRVTVNMCLSWTQKTKTFPEQVRPVRSVPPPWWAGDKSL